jgi:PAS domain-containing protein
MLRQANQAAKEILGYASPYALHARDLFRGASAVRMRNADVLGGAEALSRALDLAKGGKLERRVEAAYRRPNGENRMLELAFVPLPPTAAEPGTVMCLVDDISDVAVLSREIRIRENQGDLYPVVSRPKTGERSEDQG